MAPRKQKKEPKRPAGNLSAVIENAGVMVEQPIASTLEKNYMPYAMRFKAFPPEIALYHVYHEAFNRATDKISQCGGPDNEIEPSWRPGNL